MKKFIVLIFCMLVLMNFCANTAGAYNWVEAYSFPAKKIVTVFDHYNNDEDHSVYSFTDGDGRSCLLFVCHGTVTSEGDYAACLGGRYYTNYAAAVDNEIRYHINRGEITQGFDKVYFLTCYSGYAAQKRVTLPVLHKNLQMAIYSRNVEGLLEYLDNDWQVYYVGLYRDDPYGGRLGGLNASDARRIKIAGDSR